ncbi:hypothetical protein SLS57_010499 [Botryosphaeria dothidea]
MKRPFNMLATQPIVQIMSLYAGYGYGLAFLLSATMPLVWEGVYNQKPAIASLNYLPSSIGVIVMSQITPRLGNVIYKRLLARSPHNNALPEFRVPLLFPATLLTLVGLLWYGWSAEEKLRVVMPNIGTVIFMAGTNMTFFCINQYLIDTYTLHAASALGAATVLRGICGFCIPLFAPKMFEELGFGVGNTILAVAAVVIGFPGALMFIKTTHIIIGGESSESPQPSVIHQFKTDQQMEEPSMPPRISSGPLRFSDILPASGKVIDTETVLAPPNSPTPHCTNPFRSRRRYTTEEPYTPLRSNWYRTRPPTPDGKAKSWASSSDTYATTPTFKPI